MQNKARLNETAGSVLLWTIGMVMIALLGVNLTFSITRAVRIQAQLQAATDVAVLQAANQIDVADYYQTGRLSDIQINSNSARFVVRQVLSGENMNFTIKNLRISDSTIELSTGYRTYLWELGGARIPVNFAANSSIEIYSQ